MKARQLVSSCSCADLRAARLLVAYHLAQQRPMMGSFLDARGIQHEDGLIADEEMKPPSAEQLHDAAKSIAGAYPAEEVALYLATLVWQDPDTWGALADAPEVKAVA